MRYTRDFTLPANSIYHMMWRTVAGAFFLESDAMKRMFLFCFFRFMFRAGGKVLLHSYCVMSNHFHKAAQLKGSAKPMSKWARAAHSSFAQRLNRLLKRRGPVAQDRPKTVVCQTQEELKRVMFYGDWNPVEAGMCDHPSEYRFSSYRYYAFGVINEWTEHLTPPQFYLEMGDTPEERQAEYRRQCDEYWREKKLPEERQLEHGHALGSEKFVRNRHRLMLALGRHLRHKTWPRRDLRRMAARLLVLEPQVVAAESRAPDSQGPGS